MSPNEMFGLINIGTALAIIGVSLPLVRRKIKMNHLYGVRIKKSFESNENWYNINAYGGRQMIAWSFPLILAGLVCFLVPITEENKDLYSILMGVGPIAVCLTCAVWRTVAYAKKL